MSPRLLMPTASVYVASGPSIFDTVATGSAHIRTLSSDRTAVSIIRVVVFKVVCGPMGLYPSSIATAPSLRFARDLEVARYRGAPDASGVEVRDSFGELRK